MADRTQLYHSGCLTDGWQLFGAHPATENGVHGWWFSVWAPHAAAVSVVGDFNGWDPCAAPLAPQGGVLAGLCPGPAGLYQLQIRRYRRRTAGVRYKADPYGFHTETRPGTASKLYDIEQFPLDGRSLPEAGKQPVYHSAAEHLRGASGLLAKARKRRLLELPGSGRGAGGLCEGHGLHRHVELLPVMEHPLDDSWGYQVHRLLCPHLPVRHAGGFHVVRGPYARKRHRA